MRIAVVLTLAALLTIGVAFEAAAQRQPMAGPQVDLGAPSNRGVAGQDVPWSGPPNVNLGQPQSGGGAYFQPTPMPYQGSYARRWRNQLEQYWGGVPYNRGVPRAERRYGFPPPQGDVIYVHPYRWPTIECFGTRCQRVFPPTR